MTTACHDAIARFMPFVETGEFANVGVLLFALDALGNEKGTLGLIFDKARKTKSGAGQYSTAGRS